MLNWTRMFRDKQRHEGGEIEGDIPYSITQVQYV